ncbi:MAG: choice-of-anchor Q domain-containing protein, partial [Verrucomicrobiota bacterium]
VLPLTPHAAIDLSADGEYHAHLEWDPMLLPATFRGELVGVSNTDDVTIGNFAHVTGSTFSNLNLLECYGTIEDSLITHSLNEGLTLMGGTASHVRVTSCAGRGGSLFDDALLRNALVTGNTTSDDGGGVQLFSSRHGGGISIGLSSEIINSLVFSNTATIGGPNWYDPFICGPGMRTDDPIFVEPSSNNWRLSSTSPYINAGQNQPWTSTTTDLDQAPRVMNGATDPGAFEFKHSNTDWDGDGLTTQDETYAGIDSTSDASVFQASVVNPNNFTTSWPGISGRTYRIEWNDDCRTDSFTTLISGTPATPPINQFVPSTAGLINRYYRVVVE